MRQKAAAEAAVVDLASEMLEIQAARAARPGIAFAEDTEWQQEFDASFPYAETADQLVVHRGHQGRHASTAAHGPAAVRRRGLRQDRSRHAGGVQGRRRRLAGGRARAHHGAGRAALRTFRERMAEFPFEIARAQALLQPRKQQRRSSSGLADGTIDIVIGTHRLASGRRAIRRPRTGDHRRRAAIRRRAQGTAQRAAADGGRADDDRHAHSAHAAHVAAGHARHLQSGDAARRPAGRRDPRRRASTPS